MLNLGGTAQPGINYFARLEAGQWVTVAGGVGGTAIPPSNFPSVFALGAWDESLYVGGNFTLAGGTETCNGIAAYVGCAGFDVGDLNCDGVINTLDIEAFILALLDPDGYALMYPDCDRMLADINGDGAVNTLDIEAFVALLTGP
jgi:hypothetical protein